MKTIILQKNPKQDQDRDKRKHGLTEGNHGLHNQSGYCQETLGWSPTVHPVWLHPPICVTKQTLSLKLPFHYLNYNNTRYEKRQLLAMPKWFISLFSSHHSPPLVLMCGFIVATPHKKVSVWKPKATATPIRNTKPFLKITKSKKIRTIPKSQAFYKERPIKITQSRCIWQ